MREKRKKDKRKYIKENIQYKPKKKMAKSKKIIYSIIIILVILLIAFVANKYIVIKNKTTNLIINNNNVTANLKNEILIKNDIIYLSEADISNFFDKYIYDDTESNKIITTYEKKIATIGYEKNVININGADKKIYAHAIKENDVTYLPISEMKDVYNIELTNYNDSKVITMDSLDREQKKAVVKSNIAVKYSPNFITKTVDRIKKGETVIVISTSNDYTKIRTENGKIGYIKSNKLENEFLVRENLEDEKQIDGKINLTWDYFTENETAPDRTGTTIEGVNVVSPSFLELDEDGNLKENIGDEGKKYIEWAHENGYKIWPIFSNSSVASKDIAVTSKIMNDFSLRQELIESLVNVCVKYDLDGINIDFENMKMDDKDMFSRFIIEITPRLKEMGLVTSVDVTAPDGGENWSLCFDRNVIGNVADYIIFMAYDENGVYSTKPGTNSGYDWIKLNLAKFLQTEEIDSKKLILAVPFYTRIWTTDSNDKVISQNVISMKNIDNVVPEDAEKEWDDDLKQYYAKYYEDDNTKQIWIEDKKSIKNKVSLVNEYDLAGVGSWKKDMETDEVWNVIEDELK